MSWIQNKANAYQYTWGKDCQCWVLTETKNLSVKEEQMPAGTSEQEHYRQHADQFFYILSGQAVFDIEGEKVNMSSNDGLCIPKGTKHYIQNRATEALRFLVISQPTTVNDRINC